MMPTLNIPRQDLYDNNFINAYLGDVDKEEYHRENVIFLLFQPKDLPAFGIFLNRQYETNKSIVDDYDYNDGYIVIVYNLNPELEKDFDIIKSSKYSKVSHSFKKLFPREIKLLGKKGQPTKQSLQWMIFTKHITLIDYIETIIGTDQISRQNLESWPKFNGLLEILNINDLKP